MYPKFRPTLSKNFTQIYELHRIRKGRSLAVHARLPSNESSTRIYMHIIYTMSTWRTKQCWAKQVKSTTARVTPTGSRQAQIYAWLSSLFYFENTKFFSKMLQIQKSNIATAIRRLQWWRHNGTTAATTLYSNVQNYYYWGCYKTHARTYHDVIILMRHDRGKISQKKSQPYNKACKLTSTCTCTCSYITIQVNAKANTQKSSHT